MIAKREDPFISVLRRSPAKASKHHAGLLAKGVYHVERFPAGESQLDSPGTKFEQEINDAIRSVQ